MNTQSEGGPLPFVSVIMPVRNEAAYLERSLKSVLDQDYPKDCIEVIVADGLSTDNTKEIISEIACGENHVILIDNPKIYVAGGLNLILQQARGDIIIRVDGHCEIASDYVRNCVQHLLTKDIVGVGGPMETVGETPLAQAIAVGMSSRFGVGDSAFRTIKNKEKFVETVPFPAYWRRDIDKAGFYDEELIRNQDDEYNYRLLDSGGKLLLAPDVRSKYYSRSNLRSLWRQYFQYGLYKVRVMQKHPRQMRIRQFVPTLFVSVLIFTIVLALFVPFGWKLCLAYVGVYALVNLTASILAGLKNGFHVMVRLPMIYATLHFSYGLGFLIGLIRFYSRWQGRNS